MARNWFGEGLVLLVLLAGCDGTDGAARPKGVVADAAALDSVVIKMTEFTVPAGQEIYKCQNFSNPFGTQVDIDRFESHMPEGSHHMIVFFMDGADAGVTNGPLEDCSGSEFHPNVFGAQTPDSVIDLPSGIGVTIPATTSLRYQLHFINTSTADEVAGVTTTFHIAKSGSITSHAGQLLFSNEDISIPPNGTAQVTKTCSAPTPISLLGVSAHVHRHAVDFVATTDGTQLYETKSWTDATPVRFNPPFALPANQGVTFTCSYVNDTAVAVTFGQSALTDEMCILGGIYYPVTDVTSPNIVCF